MFFDKRGLNYHLMFLTTIKRYVDEVLKSNRDATINNMLSNYPVVGQFKLDYDEVHREIVLLLKHCNDIDNHTKEEEYYLKRLCKEAYASHTQFILDSFDNPGRINTNQSDYVNRLPTTIKGLEKVQSHLMEKVKELKEILDKKDRSFKLSEINNILEAVINDMDGIYSISKEMAVIIHYALNLAKEKHEVLKKEEAQLNDFQKNVKSWLDELIKEEKT